MPLNNKFLKPNEFKENYQNQLSSIIFNNYALNMSILTYNLVETFKSYYNGNNLTLNSNSEFTNSLAAITNSFPKFIRSKFDLSDNSNHTYNNQYIIESSLIITNNTLLSLKYGITSKGNDNEFESNFNNTLPIIDFSDDGILKFEEYKIKHYSGTGSSVSGYTYNMRNDGYNHTSSVEYIHIPKYTFDKRGHLKEIEPRNSEYLVPSTSNIYRKIFEGSVSILNIRDETISLSDSMFNYIQLWIEIEVSSNKFTCVLDTPLLKEIANPNSNSYLKFVFPNINLGGAIKFRYDSNDNKKLYCLGLSTLGSTYIKKIYGVLL